MHREEIVGSKFTESAVGSHAAQGSYYFDPDIYALETDVVFGREWLYGCHSTEIATAGDYVVTEVAGHSVLIIRDRDDQIRGFYNVCQHRGHQLATASGHTPNVLVCPYHAWSYSLTGELRGAPKMREVPAFCRDGVALAPVAIDVVGGFVFVNLAADADPLRVVAPDFEPILLSMVGECEQVKLAKTTRYEIEANWKVVTENFLEAYHVEYSGPAHQALATIIDTDTYRFELADRTIEYMAQGGAVDQLPYDGQSSSRFTNSKGAPFHQVFLYPNMTFSVFPGTNMLFVFSMAPNGPERCSEQVHYFTLDGGLDESTDSAQEYIGSLLNGEDIAIVESVQRGIRSPGYRPGRLMVDAEEKAGWGEQFVHHFGDMHVRILTDRS